MLEPATAAIAWLAGCQATVRPRRRGGPASVRKAMIEPTSPPSETPWTTRARIARIGAQTPIAE